MKITRIAVHQVNLPYAHGTYRLSGGRSYTSFDATICSVTTDTGLTGWGESTPFGATYIAAHAEGVRAGLGLVAPAILGRDPRHHDRVYDVMDAALVGHPHVKSALDVACWDVAAQAAGMPVCDLLGGRVAGPVPVISSIPTDTPEAMRANVARHRAAGYRGHSLKVGAAEAEGGPMLDAERLRACLADREPGEWFLADANGGMTAEHALRFLALLPPGCDFVLEAPCATWAETQRLRARCPVPILLDELVQSDADVVQAIRSEVCDGIGIKISKQGGLTRSLRQMQMAEAAGLVVSVQETWGSTIAFAAILHLAQATPRHILRCALDPRGSVGVVTAGFDAEVTGGGAEAPRAPGLGLTPDMDVLGPPVAIYD